MLYLEEINGVFFASVSNIADELYTIKKKEVKKEDNKEKKLHKEMGFNQQKIITRSVKIEENTILVYGKPDGLFKKDGRIIIQEFKPYYSRERKEFQIKVGLLQLHLYLWILEECSPAGELIIYNGNVKKTEEIRYEEVNAEYTSCIFEFMNNIWKARKEMNNATLKL